MSISIFSFITSVLLCNVYIAFIALFYRDNRFIMRFSLVPLILFIAECQGCQGTGLPFDTLVIRIVPSAYFFLK